MQRLRFVNPCGTAATCPDPPVYANANATCPVPLKFVGGTMWPSCYTTNCSYWGPSKAIDGLEKSITSLALTSSATNPYLQLDLGNATTSIVAVRIVARADCG